MRALRSVMLLSVCAYHVIERDVDALGADASTLAAVVGATLFAGACVFLL
jgi:ribonuclease PH